MKMAGQKYTTPELLLARIADFSELNVWTKTKDGQNGRNKPESVYLIMTGRVEKKSEDTLSFDSAEEYERERARVVKDLERNQHNG